MSDLESMVEDWPAPNTLVWLRLPCCGAEHPSRIEDFNDGNVVVAAPIAPHTTPIPPPAETEGFFIGWVSEGGALELPVLLSDRQDEPVPLWTLHSIGPAVGTQRRAFVRVDMDIEVTLYLIEGGKPNVASTLDMSEGGLRCVLDKWAIDPGGRTFEIEMTLDQKGYNLRGQFAWFGKLDDKEKRIAGVRFIDTDPAVADNIRSVVFKQQIEERRKRLI